MYRENQQSGSFILHIELWPAFSASVFEDIFHSLVYIVSAFVKKKWLTINAEIYFSIYSTFSMCVLYQYLLP